jgi:hypothetical protein
VLELERGHPKKALISDKWLEKLQGQAHVKEDESAEPVVSSSPATKKPATKEDK